MKNFIISCSSCICGYYECSGMDWWRGRIHDESHQLKYSIAHAQGLESNFNKFGVFVIPAIAFSVSDKVTLASHIGDGLYYNQTWMKDVARSNEFGFNLFHGISFGAYYFF